MLQTFYQPSHSFRPSSWCYLFIMYFFFQVLRPLFIDIQVGTIATGLETAEYKVESGVSAVTAVECTRSGEAKAVGKAGQGQGQKSSTLGPWAPRPQALLLLSPDFRLGLGILWTTFYRSKVQRCCCPSVIKSEGFQSCIPPPPLAQVGP